MKILCCGLTVCDIVVDHVDENYMIHDSIPVDSVTMHCGGDAFNVATNSASLGDTVTLCSKVGNDQFGRYIAEQARRYGVNTVFAEFDGSTSTSIVNIRTDRERFFAYAGKANHDFGLADIPEEAIADADMVSLNSAGALWKMDNGGTIELFRNAKARGKTTALDTTFNSGSNWTRQLYELLSVTDIFMPSLYEAELYAGVNEFAELLRFYRRFGNKVFGLKLGKNGCFVTDWQEAFFMPTYGDAPCVDTTGAGDAFFSGFCHAYMRGGKLEACAAFANAAGSVKVGKLGASGAIESEKQIVDFIEQHQPLERRVYPL